jgi:hypothetical protein
MPCPFEEPPEELATVQAMFQAGGDPTLPTRALVPPQSRPSRDRDPRAASPPSRPDPPRSLLTGASLLPVALDRVLSSGFAGTDSHHPMRRLIVTYG